MSEKKNRNWHMIRILSNATIAHPGVNDENHNL
jgi:hypothetical protein